MTEMERRRMRKEAADAVTSRRPGPSDAMSESALRRYLGIVMFEELRHRRARREGESTSTAHES